MNQNPPTRDEVARYLARDQDDLLDELSVYAEASGVTKGPTETWKQIEPRLRQAVCQDWNWCQRRQDNRFDDKITLAFALAQLLTATTLPWSLPAALVAVILVKFGLDKFCKCQ
jgi:hypothetical protein